MRKLWESESVYNVYVIIYIIILYNKYIMYRERERDFNYTNSLPPS